MRIARFYLCRLALLALLIAPVAAGCSALDTFMLPPEYRITPSPYLTRTPKATVTATGTLAPLQSPEPIPVSGPAWSTKLSGEIYFTLDEAGSSAEAELARLPAGCVDCPEPERLPALPGGDLPNEPLTWSPDGRYAAVVAGDGLYRYDPEAGRWKQLSDLEDIQPRVAWSPDGEWIAFQARRNNTPDVFAVRSDGSELKTATSGRLANLKAVALAGWQEERIVLIAGGPLDYYAYVTTLANPRPARFSDAPVFRGREAALPVMPLSPDGQWVAYSEQNEQVGSLLSLIPIQEGVDPRMLFSSRDAVITGYAWSPDSEWLVFWSDFDGQGLVQRVRTDGSGLETIYQGGPIQSVIYAPDASGAVLIADEQDGRERLLYALPGEDRGYEISVEGVSARAAWRAPSWRPE